MSANSNVKSIFRKLEVIIKKMISLEEPLKFNKEYIQHDLLPIHTPTHPHTHTHTHTLTLFSSLLTLREIL